MTSTPLRLFCVFAVAVFCFYGISLCSAADDFAPLFPFVISHDAPENITNIVSWNDSEHISSWRHAPAGKHGFIRVQDGRFVHDEGRILILGTNTCFSANFPKKEQAEQVAARLARLGFNCVRLHHMDSRDIWGGPNAKSQSTLDPDQLDKLDYFIYHLKLQGIYVNINLHVSRFMDERDGFTDKDKRPKYDKGLDNFYPPLIEAQKKYARDLLTHVNPYTKTAYFEEPAVAMVEINNENSVISQWSNLPNMPDPYQAELRRQWNEFLRKKYRTTETLRAAWNCIDVLLEDGTIPVPTRYPDVLPTVALDDFCDFLLDIEEKYWVGFYRFLKEEIGVRQPICGTQLRYGSTTIQAKLDYIDNHSYWTHPTFPGRPWDGNNWFIRSRALVKSPEKDMFPLLGTGRVHGKPYTISEIDSPFPNPYAAELLPMMLAFGRFQDWDGLFHFAYTHGNNTFNTNKNTGFFDMVGNTVKLAHMPACAAIFRRGDVSPAKKSVLGSFTPEQERTHFKKDRRTGNFLFQGIGLDPRLTLLYQTALDISGQTTSPMPEIAEDAFLPKDAPSKSELGCRNADRSELTWGFMDTKSPFFIAGAKNSALFTGFAHEDRTLTLTDGVTLTLSGKTRLNWATISLVSVDAKGFKPEKSGEKPVRVLVTATGLMQNKGMDIQSLGEDRITFGSRWGEGPVLCEGIPLSLRFDGVSSIRCYPLDGSGNRKGQFDVQGATVPLGPGHETVWYELEIR